MRTRLLLAVVLTAGCVTPSPGSSVTVDPLALSLARVTLEARPALTVTMTNRSATVICVRAELLRNPHSNEIDLKLRDRSGRTIKPEDPGFLPPPNVQPVPIAPGESVQGQFFLDSRFKLKGSSKRLPEELSAQVTFLYDLCDASQSRLAVSAWQRI
jgi:hypothetical protein